MKKMITVIASIIALTVMAPGHADELQEAPVKQNFLGKVIDSGRDQLDALVQTITKPWIDFSVSAKDEDCLAKNIFYEAGSESEEGKAAVAIVTINRVKDERFGGSSICEIVNKRTVVVRSHKATKTEVVQTGWFGRPEERTTSTVIMSTVPVCQFSWVCHFIRKPQVTDERWEESQRVARNILNDGYTEYRAKYADALYFHSTGIRPPWAKQKRWVTRHGGHVFYADNRI